MMGMQQWWCSERTHAGVLLLHTLLLQPCREVAGLSLLAQMPHLLLTGVVRPMNRRLIALHRRNTGDGHDTVQQQWQQRRRKPHRDAVRLKYMYWVCCRKVQTSHFAVWQQ